MNHTAKYRAWTFTVNNYTPEQEQHIQTNVTREARYLIYGREIGKEGTPHLQGYVYFHTQRTHRSVLKMIPSAWMEPSKGSAQENEKYSKKDKDFFEAGEIPVDKTEAQKRGGQGNKERWERVAKLARKGDMKTIEQDDPQIFILHGQRLKSLYIPETKNMDGPSPHEWWVGESGTGKSRLLWELYPNHFQKQRNKWWDGYNYEDVVAIEEWSPRNDCTTSNLKEWADRFTFTGEIKGGVLQKLRPKKLIVLSNYTPQQCFLNSEDLKPILRRFTVMHFPNQIQHARFRAAEQAEAPLDTQEVTTAEEAMPTLEDLLDDDDESVIDFEDFFQDE